jgi:hypothetical protein
MQATARTEEGPIFVEGHLIVTDGSTVCPHPSLADSRRHEPYESYVRRHCVDHQLGEFSDLEDAERNLALWCLYFYAKHIQGNQSLGVGEAIAAAWEPCWEDAEFLSNDTFDPVDLEQEVPWEKRFFRLRPFAERSKRGAVKKRKKKLTKARGTQKTSWGKAFVTWKHLRARFLFDNCNYRVLVISATSTLARDHYFDPLKTLWMIQRNIKRLFGVPYSNMTTTKRMCLLVPGSKTSRDHLRMRWNVDDAETSGEATVSFMIAGVTTTTVGQRWDLVVLDDLVTPANSRTPEQRMKVKGQIADLRKQLDGQGEVVYFNTPHNASDASAQIDHEQGHEYHILHRPAAWTNSDTGEVELYWQRNALGRPVWDATRIEEERKQPDFHSQVMLRAKSEEDVLFTKDMFKIIDPATAPIEIRYGLGCDISPEQQLELDRERARISAWGFVDPCGGERATADGDDTAMIGIRLDRFGNIYFVHVNGGKWNANQEHEGMFSLWLRSRATFIEYEVSGAHSQHVKQTYSDFQSRKSFELNRVISMPIVWTNAASGNRISKLKRQQNMFPFASTGRVYILSDAGPQEKIDTLVDQYVDLGYVNHDDYADASSRILSYIRPPSFAEAAAARADEPKELMEDGNLTLNVGKLFKDMNSAETKVKNWGLGGRG